MLRCNLRLILAEKKIDSITEVVELSKVSRNSIAKLYHEKEIETLKLETLFKLCDALHCSLSELIEYTQEDEK